MRIALSTGKLDEADHRRAVETGEHSLLASSGRPLPCVDIRIVDDDGRDMPTGEAGEILVRAPNVAKGYLNRPEENAATFRDGWLHTGDIGEIDEDGYLKITDRKKDIVVLSGGDNVSPTRVESFLTLEPEIAQAMVAGDKRPHLVGLVVPDPDFLKTWARDNGKPAELAALSDDPDLKTALSAAVERANSGLSNLERVRRFAVPDEAFTVENHMLTPTLKIRRHVIRERFGDLLENLYGKG